MREFPMLKFGASQIHELNTVTMQGFKALMGLNLVFFKLQTLLIIRPGLAHGGICSM
jgi:hypothetical protein